MATQDQRLIERGFPCHQVGAETQRERGASSALPPLYFLHVWWARRPLTPSRAAIVASLTLADTDPEDFVRQLGIERVQALVQDEPWILTGELLAQVETNTPGAEILPVDERVLRRLQEEDERRAENRALITELKAKDASLVGDPVLARWEQESQPLPQPWPRAGEYLPVQRGMGDPAWAKERIAWETAHKIRTADDKYGYGRAYTNSPCGEPIPLTILDPTAGGGSIPFEALRLGYCVIANELNPVATTILYATLEYPARFGSSLAEDIERWGQRLRQEMVKELEDLFPSSPLDEAQRQALRLEPFRGDPAQDLLAAPGVQQVDGQKLR